MEVTVHQPYGGELGRRPKELLIRHPWRGGVRRFRRRKADRRPPRPDHDPSRPVPSDGLAPVQGWVQRTSGPVTGPLRLAKRSRFE
jgi:hypothetical protein